MNKGATQFDESCHEVFESKGDGFDYLLRKTGVKCGCCGHELTAYYCESRLYLIKCECCEKMAFVKANSPVHAAYRTFGHAVYSLEEIGEETAVFFSHVPIDEAPVYVGSTIDCDFPWDEVVCGMDLPCPGTDGAELNNFFK